ncbi:hypothetical protein DAPPUDRAFT_329228 [Daphnia pulex]|uniref:Major facilitator superfamily (MFS) profile domain-containing protein n=1 Tax=Daphnia pulex TaxID=6669 RepID=E9HG06_DAPPU|nr:hypothetical protein DAPPUDRAFT_329228 [Daphnia pulex]|eukprot:EFX69308.1 hypothetical protein DAPPUDRAFT_329228 [Daphnia pulex]
MDGDMEDSNGMKLKNDDSNITLESNKNSKFRITVEPLGFLYLTANILQMIVTPNLFLQKVCAVNFRMNATLCDPRSKMNHNNTQLSDRVQGYVSTLNIYTSLIDNIPPILLMLFLLPWSDKHGRKPLMIAPLIGHVLGTLSDMANYYIESLPAEYLLISAVPVGLTGGRGIFFMSLHRYVIDITTTEARTWRLALIGGIIGISVPIGTLISGYIYASGGNIAIWGTSLAVYAVAFLYVLFGFSDSRGTKSIVKTTDAQTLEKFTFADQNNMREDMSKESCVGILNNLIRCFTETFKRRPGYKRACVSILMASMCLALFATENHGIGYLFARKKFGWDAPDWAYFMTLASSTALCGTLIILPILSGYFKVRDGIIGVLSLLSNIGSNLTMAFAVSPLMMYLSTIGDVLVPLAGIVIRSIFSKTLISEELSYAYAVLASLEAIVPLITSPTINVIYRATLSFFPGCIFLVRALALLVLLGLFGILLLLIWKDSQSTQVQPFYPNNDEKTTHLKRPVTVQQQQH